MANIIDGKALALKHEEKLKNKLGKFNGKRMPRCISFSNFEDLQVDKYTEIKGKKAASLGIEFIIIYTTDGMSETELSEKIIEESKDQRNDGVMIQLPLPSSLQDKTDSLIELINLDKDVDGLTGKGEFLPATVKAVLSILDSLRIDLGNLVFAVVGSEGHIGKPLVKALKQKDFKVIEVDKKNPSSSLADIKEADVVISCVGKVNLISVEDIKENAVLIDVGLGDFNPSCYPKSSFYTPKIGGVGPMTVISLMENIVAARGAS